MKCVVFDMDGVLIDSEPFWQHAETEVFGSVGVPITLEDCKQTTGMRMDAAVDYWFERYPWPSPSRREIEDRVKRRVQDLLRKEGQPIEGAVNLVRRLHSAGVVLAVCSSSPDFLIQTVCEMLDVRHCFAVFQSAEACMRGKPFPDPYLATASRLGLAPQYCVAIEDSINGMRSARNAGMHVVGYVPIGHSRQPALGLCDMICEQLDELSPENLLALTNEHL